MQRARQLQQTGHYADARAILDTVLSAEPDNGDAWQLRLAVSDTPDDRERVLRARLRLRPDDAEWWEQLVELKTVEAPAPLPPHRYRWLYFVAALLVMVTAAVALVFVSHNPLQADVDRLTADNHDLAREIQQLNEQLQLIQSRYRDLQAVHKQLQSEYTRSLEKYAALHKQYTDLQTQHAVLINRYNGLTAQFNTLQEEFDQLTYEYRAFRDTAIAPPYIYIHERRIELVFKRTSGSTDRWWIDFEGLEEAVEEGSALRNPRNNRLSLVDLEGFPEQQLDLRPFVNPAPFKDVMAQLYYEVGGDEQAFLYETWHIMGQLTGYVTDTLRETPRYPLETLLSGGGDCEDTSILFASLVKAAPVNWDVSLFYMDGDNPVNTHDINHVIVLVETPTARHFVETTSHSVMEPYIYTGINGWKFFIR